MTDLPKTWTTYAEADGSLIAGEYAWVDGSEWFDDDDEPRRLIRRTWTLVAEDTVEHIPLHALCPACEGEGEVGGTDCDFCGGMGGHPLAGEMIPAHHPDRREEHR